MGIVACACGPVVGTPLGEAQGDGTTGGADDWAETGVDATDGDDATSGDATTGGDGGVCGVASSASPLAVLTRSEHAAILRADGTEVELPFPSDPVAPSYVLGVDSHAERVVVAAGSSTFVDDVFRYTGTLSMFDTAGTELWIHAEDHGQIAGPYLGADGTVAATLSLEEGTSEAVVVVEGEITRSAAGFYVLGPPDAAGHVPGTVAADGRPGWWRGDNGLVAGIRHPSPYWYVRDDDAFVYVLEIEGMPTIVRESLDDVTETALPELDGFPGLQVEWRSSASWVLVMALDVQGLPQGWARIEVATGEMTWLDTTLPGAWTRLECYGNSAVLDRRGRLLQPARDAATAQVLRLDPSTGAWDPLGRLLTQVDAVDATAVGDSLVVRADGSGMTFCPLQTFEPAPEALAGTSLQILRSGDRESIVVPTDRWPVVREDGRCAALVGAETVTLLDLEANAQLEVSPDGEGGGYGVTWWRP